MFEYNYTVMIGLIIGGLILLKYFSNKAISPFPIFAFPSDKRKNFYIIQKGRFHHFYHPYMFKWTKVKWLHRCCRRTFETKCVGDNFEMLMFWSFSSPTSSNFQHKGAPTFKRCQQYRNSVINIYVAMSNIFHVFEFQILKY